MAIFLLFLCVVANSYCIIQKIDYNSLIEILTTTNTTEYRIIQKVDYNSMTTLNTTNTTEYFYMETKNFRKSVFIYLYFKDESFKLNKDNLKYCFTSIPPNEELSCIFDDLGGPFATLKKKHYFYKISYNNDGYLIIRYDGKNSNGSLKVRAASDNLYDIIKDTLNTALSILAIIGIIFGSCVGLALLCGFIGACLSCLSEKTTSETIEGNKTSSTEEDKEKDKEEDKEEDKDLSLFPSDSQ